MAKRTPGLEGPEKVLPRSVHSLGNRVEQMYCRHYVLHHWKDLVGEAVAANVHPLRIEFQKLVLYAPDAVWRNEIRMRQPEILQLVNQCAGSRLVTELQFGQRWKNMPQGQASAAGPEEVPEPVWRRILSGTNLTDEELTELRESLEKIGDEELRGKMLRLRIKQKKLEKWRREQGWHPCQDCGRLCEKEEVLCNRCRRRHRQELRTEIRKLLLDIPWARPAELKEYLPEITPYMVNNVRADMVQQLALKVSLEQSDSMDAQNLVMLYRCLPPEQLTEDILKRTLYSLKNNLSRPEGFKAHRRYDIIPLRHKKSFPDKKIQRPES